jgi:chromosome segregation ATPase
VADNVTDILDQTLSPELQKVVAMLSAGQPAEEAKPETPAKGETTMADTPSLEQVKATVAELLAQKDQEKAVAAQITSLNTEVSNAKAALAKAVADAASMEKDLKAQNEALSAKVAEGEKALASKDGEITGLKAQLTEKDKAIAEKTAQLNALVTEKAIAARVEKLKEAGLASDERVAKCSAKADDGTLKVSDEAFDGAVAELKAAFEAGKASVKPAEAPKPGQNTEKKPEQTTASKTETPAAPALDEAGKAAQATAALLNSGAPAGGASKRSVFAQIGVVE